MDSRIVPELIGLGVLILISALLSGAEAAYFSLGRTRLRELAEQQGQTPGPLAPLLAQPHDLLVTLLVGITVVNIGASALAAAIAGQIFGSHRARDRDRGHGVPAHRVRRGTADDAGGRASAALRGVGESPGGVALVLLRPIRAGLGAFTAITLRLVGSERQAGRPEISEEELRTLVDVGAREGVVERSEREMIHRVFELEDTLVRAVMVPRPDMFCLDVATEPGLLLPQLREQLHSRVPVYEDTVHQIVGVLYTKDLLPYLDGLPAGFDLRQHLHPPYFVPESKRADALLREFQAKKLHLAIVVDEYGGTAGLVTLEDLLEELVGEIRDEYDEDERLIQRVTPRTFRVSGRLPIDELNAATGLQVPNEAFDTVGGWVLDLFGRVPHKGEKKETDGVRVAVEKVERTRVLEVLVTLPDLTSRSEAT